MMMMSVDANAFNQNNSSNSCIIDNQERNELRNAIAISNNSIGNTTFKMSKTNLYLKGLPNHYSDSDIMGLAADKSLVRSVKAAIEDDGRCKGYGFIDFVTPEDAKEGLNYIQKNYPNISVKFAKENEKDKTNLYVTNLPKSWSSKDSEKLKELFQKYGEIQSSFVMVEKCGNKPLGVGFVRFFHEEAAKAALADLEENPWQVDDDCDGYLEAKYADKHTPESRRRGATGSGGLGGNGSATSSAAATAAVATNGALINAAAVAAALGAVNNNGTSGNFNNKFTNCNGTNVNSSGKLMSSNHVPLLSGAHRGSNSINDLLLATYMDQNFMNKLAAANCAPNGQLPGHVPSSSAAATTIYGPAAAIDPFYLQYLQMACMGATGQSPAPLGGLNGARTNSAASMPTSATPYYDPASATYYFLPNTGAMATATATAMIPSTNQQKQQNVIPLAAVSSSNSNSSTITSNEMYTSSINSNIGHVAVAAVEDSPPYSVGNVNNGLSNSSNSSSSPTNDSNTPAAIINCYSNLYIPFPNSTSITNGHLSQNIPNAQTLFIPGAPFIPDSSLSFSRQPQVLNFGQM